MAIRFCHDKDYGGTCQEFDVGSYTKSAISGSGKIGNDNISSVKILKPGFYVRAFKDDNYLGTEKNFNTDVGNLKDVGFNDAISSFIVVDGNPPPLAALPPVATTPPPATNVPATAAPVPADSSSGLGSSSGSNDASETPAVPAAESGSSMWIWIVAMILFLVLAVVGGGAYYVLRKKPAPAQQSAELRSQA